ncbi:hypothetical protein TrCOL_g12470 [Triparma columacea]|uniref:Uncharacterized protein n=1 Tax=Triparma columacea TaxID=722753 RepID=A0A9W7FZY2_9STRA|nr:hypothetical protein TrCOL_g12470 [Triparma columacea]
MPAPPVPPAVKEALSALPMDKSVSVRSYIAGLRDTIKDLEAQLNPPAHSHMHGHEVCHENHDHGSHDHGSHDHGHDHKEGACDHPSHDHGHDHKEGSCDHPSHDHGGHDHKDEGHDHGHGHEHKDEGHDHGHGHKDEGHDHGHGHKEEGHDHGHGHGHKEEEEVPAWKKRALDADPNAAPFGGSWGDEMQVDATAKK